MSGKIIRKATMATTAYALTDYGHIVKILFSETGDGKDVKTVKVLNLENSSFSLDYKKHHGPITAAISEDPKEVFLKLSHAISQIEQRELAFMRNIFLLNNDTDSSYDMSDTDKEDNSPGRG